MSDRLCRDITGEMLDNYMANIFDVDEATEEFYKRQLTSPFLGHVLQLAVYASKT